MTGMIFHIVDKTTWRQASESGRYDGDTLQTEGFIHASTIEQVAGVANARFRGRSGLVVLEIDPERVARSGVEIRYENLEGGKDLFPHLYGALPLDAVVRVLPFEPGADGTFTPPTGSGG
jgi:uncharacterized protein (DUF952 family)